MIGTGTYAAIAIMLAGGILLPAAICIWWLVTRKERFTTVLTGAVIWFVFAMLLEQIPIAILFRREAPWGDLFLNNAAVYAVTGALLAGIFEETGRYLAFRIILKKRTNRETSISYGIGHGGFEAMFLLGMSGIQNLLYASMIKAGTFQGVIDQAAAAGADVSALEKLPEQIAGLTPLMGCMSTFERVTAILFHIGASVLVFYAVRHSKTWLYPLAILLHALMDVPAALYQQGILNLYVTEAILALYAIVVFVIIYRSIYRKMEADSVEAEAVTGP